MEQRRVGAVGGRVNLAKAELDKIQTQLQMDPLSRDLIQEERVKIEDLMRATKVEESMQRLKSREQVITLGDNNTEFFFKSIQARRITCLKGENRELLEDINSIGMECARYYKEIYELNDMPEWSLEGVGNIVAARTVST